MSVFGESAQGTDPYIAYQTSKYHSLRSAAFHQYHVLLFELRRRRYREGLSLERNNLTIDLVANSLFLVDLTHILFYACKDQFYMYMCLSVFPNHRLLPIKLVQL